MAIVPSVNDLTTNTTGFPIDYVQLTNPTPATVDRQQVTIGDPATWGSIAEVTGATVVGNQSGLVVHNVVSAANVALVTSQVQISTSPSMQLDSSLAGDQRRVVKLKNGGPNPVYVGPDSSVSVTTGFELAPGDSDDFEIGPALSIWGVASAGTNTVYVMQLG
jgi:hypothetical protein